jgi:hypothetical protein
MRLAERSLKGAVEDQQDVFVAAKIRQANLVAVIVGQAKVGGDLVERDTRQFASPTMIVGLRQRLVEKAQARIAKPHHTRSSFAQEMQLACRSNYATAQGEG